MLSKLFGGIRMTWKRLIIFAVISGVITGLIALLVPDNNSIHQIAVTFEAWIVLAIIVVVNCEKPAEAALKTFVYFLISQPLVYLVQVPFNRLGFGLFRYYWPYWFIWTAATLPGAFIAWYIKKGNTLSGLILSVALAALIWIGTDYLKTVTGTFPRYLLAMLFCYGAVPVLILYILRRKPERLLAAGIALLVLAASLFFAIGMDRAAGGSGERNREDYSREWGYLHQLPGRSQGREQTCGCHPDGPGREHVPDSGGSGGLRLRKIPDLLSGKTEVHTV